MSLATYLVVVVIAWVTWASFWAGWAAVVAARRDVPSGRAALLGFVLWPIGVALVFAMNRPRGAGHRDVGRQHPTRVPGTGWQPQRWKPKTKR